MRQKRRIISKAYSFSLFLFFFLLAADQLTKYLIRTSMPLGSTYNFGSILSFTYVQNTGISFGMLKGYNWIFTIISFLALFAFGYYFFKQKDFRFAIVCAGITGNLADRLFLGYVVDFINLHWWPIFNVADSTIFVGILLVLLNHDDGKKGR